MNEHTSAGAVLSLRAKGIENAAAVLGGYDALVQKGFPVEKGKPQPVYHPENNEIPKDPLAPGVEEKKQEAVGGSAESKSAQPAAPVRRKKPRTRRTRRG
jgi:3-mercaptopyruvate sulfurtransferase SseA